MTSGEPGQQDDRMHWDNLRHLPLPWPDADRWAAPTVPVVVPTDLVPIVHPRSNRIVHPPA